MIHILTALMLTLQAATPSTVSPAPPLPADSKPYFRAHFSPDCASWREASAGKAKDSDFLTEIHKRWVLGYITGFNVAGPDVSGNLLSTASVDEVWVAIDDYCARNPSHYVVDAMRPIAAAIIRRRGIPANITPVPETKKRATVLAATTCQDWTNHRGDALMRLTDAVLLHGYITAYNQWGPDAVGDAIGPDDQTVTENVTDRWCGDHPSALLIGAVAPLIDYVSVERLAGRLPPGGKRTKDQVTPEEPPKR